MSKKYFTNYLQEVEKAYLSSGTSYPKDKERELQFRNFRGTRYRLYKIDKVKLKSRMKKGFSFSDFTDQEKAKIWNYIFKNTEYLGVGDLAISHFKKYQTRKNHNLIQYWPLLRTWAPKIENWVHGDMIASLYCDMLSEAPKIVYPELKKWSESQSHWKKRMAIVSLLYYYSPKRNLLPYRDIISLVEPHLEVDHYYLQKAIGWNLRELTRAYPKETWRFLNKNVLRITPVAFSTAMEKIPMEERKPLKEKRKQARRTR